MTDPGTFVLDPRLEGDSVPVCDLDLCTVRLMKDARFPWVILVPRIADLAELIDLSHADRQVVTDEIDRVTRALYAHTSAEKMNVAALGNMVRQLHVHVIARFAGDAAWPGPVWGVGTAQAYTEEDRAERLEALRAALIGA
ncbi:MAG: HIT domain-containing protein [Alphaproteobacteria bacterium]|jgi:diadenosine tetraphosphate (Ap4A) HIT family hydrolase